MKIPNKYVKAKLDKTINLDLFASWYLFGLPGTGKTHFAWAYRIARNQNIKKEYDKNPNIQFRSLIMINWAVFCSEMRYSDFGKRGNRIKKLIEIDILIIDDIGSEVKTDFSDDILFQILNERFEWKKRTGFTSNHDVADLEYDVRIISRITGIVKKNKFEIKGNDRRISEQE